MVRAYKSGQTAQCMRGNGSIIELTEKVGSCFLRVMFMKEISRTTNLVGMALTSIRMVPNTLASGLMISSMDLELKFGKMAPNTMELIATAARMVLGATSGMMDLCSLVTGMKIKYTDLEHTNGLTAEVTKVNGDRTTWKALVFTGGKMAVFTQASISMTKSMATASTSGRIPANMPDIGPTESSTASVSTRCLRKTELSMGFGKMEKELNGSPLRVRAKSISLILTTLNTIKAWRAPSSFLSIAPSKSPIILSRGKMLSQKTSLFSSNSSLDSRINLNRVPPQCEYYIVIKYNRIIDKTIINIKLL